MSEHRSRAAGRAGRVTWYRARSGPGRRARGYLAIVALLGVLGGLAMGSVAAGRRTQSSFATFLASTNPSQLTLVTFGAPNGGTHSGAFDATFVRAISALAGVRRIETAAQPLGVPLGPGGVPLNSSREQVTTLVSLDGLYFDVDRATVVAGQMASASSTDEFVTTPSGAAAEHWHLGEVVPYGFFSAGQISAPGFGAGRVRPVVSVRARLVGLVEFNSTVVEDDVDRQQSFALFSPALGRRLLAERRPTTYATYFGIDVGGTGASVSRVEREVEAVLPSSLTAQFHLASIVADRAARATRPDSIALEAFGAIAALVAVALVAQAIARQIRSAQGDAEVLRALGADPLTTSAIELLGVLAALVLGCLLAIGVALALSPLGPIGPVRAVYPDRGVAFDPLVLGFGTLAAFVLSAALAVALSRSSEPSRRLSTSSTVHGRASLLARAAASAGAGVPAVVGVGFAMGRSNGRSDAASRSALWGTALAVAVVAATLTFGSGLQTLLGDPPLFGWNWNYALGSFDSPDVPLQSIAALSHDRLVQAWSGAELADLSVDGAVIPAIFESEHARVEPPLLSGHAIESSDQIVLGAGTLAQLHLRLGDEVTVSYGSPKSAPFYAPARSMTVVGTATMPAIGFASAQGDHTSMGTGVLVATSFIPPALQRAESSRFRALDGPEFVFVRMRPGVSAAAAKADLARVTAIGARALSEVPGQGGGTVSILGVQRPGEIANFGVAGATPALLAASLAAGAVVALGFTLVSSVRRRRRELALLKALGLTRRSLSSLVAVQASVIGLVGLVVGLPVGVALGRWLWSAFAREIYAVPQPSVPGLSLVFVALGAVALVNLVALLPGRSAARTSAALVLRSE